MISTTGEYALRATVYLAQNHGSSRTTAEIAAATKVPQGYLSKILQAMGRHDLVDSQRGLGGGFRLTRHPDEITVLDVLDSVDASVERITKCPLGIQEHEKLCPVHKLVDDAICQVENAFRDSTIESLLTGTSAPLCKDPETLVARLAARPPREPRK